MGWLEAYVLAKEMEDRARAGRDADGEPICGGCRNRVDEQATKCEHCGANLVAPRRVGLVGGLFGGVGTVLGLFGLLFLFVGLGELGGNPIGGIIILLLGVGLTATGAIALYPAYRFKKDKPARELALRRRLPSFLSEVFDAVR